MSKVAVWYKDGQYVEHVGVSDNHETMEREGHTLFIVVYEGDQIAQVDLIQNGQTTSFTSARPRTAGTKFFSSDNGWLFGGAMKGVKELR